MVGVRGSALPGLRTDLAHSYFTHSAAIGGRCSGVPCAAQPAPQLTFRHTHVLTPQGCPSAEKFKTRLPARRSAKLRSQIISKRCPRRPC